MSSSRPISCMDLRGIKGVGHACCSSAPGNQADCADKKAMDCRFLTGIYPSWTFSFSFFEEARAQMEVKILLVLSREGEELWKKPSPMVLLFSGFGNPQIGSFPKSRIRIASVKKKKRKKTSRRQSQGMAEPFRLLAAHCASLRSDRFSKGTGKAFQL